MLRNTSTRMSDIFVSNTWHPLRSALLPSSNWSLGEISAEHSRFSVDVATLFKNKRSQNLKS